MKQSMFSKQGQKGFTLLELLIVVTIIAILSVGAILAYEGLTEQAQSATAANNTATADQAIRNYRAVTGNYPNQWDHLVGDGAAAGAPLAFVADETYRVLGAVDATALSAAIAEAFEEVGVEEFQVRTTAAATTGVEPNLQHNEGATSGDSEEVVIEDAVDFLDRLVVIPTAIESGAGVQACTFAGNTPTVIRAVDDTIVGAGNEQEALDYMITVNDNIGEERCHLVAAFGFGHDAAHSTVNSNVAIAAAPAYVSNKIKPADNYARYIALFDLGSDGNNNGTVDGNITADEINQKPKLIGLIDPEGNVIDQNVAAANDADAAN
jgi:prepilin-type N-terminal cleavage/methylation domain-containing protein